MTERKITQNANGQDSKNIYKEGEDKSFNLDVKTNLITKERLISGIVGAIIAGVILLFLEYFFFQCNC
jgi:hypothetical protein